MLKQFIPKDTAFNSIYPFPQFMSKKVLLFIVVVWVCILVVFFWLDAVTRKNNSPVTCTMDAKICPDGSAVGRTGPNCEFSPCPIAE